MTDALFSEEITETNTLTGNKQKSHQLFYHLKKSFETAERIDIIVSFLMTSGIQLLVNSIKSAVERNVPIRILTGKYLNITQPDAIALLKKEFGDKIDLRFFLTDTNQSFHPKAYIFHNKNGSDIFVGLSNIFCAQPTRKPCSCSNWAFFNGGTILQKIGNDELLSAWKDFFSTNGKLERFAGRKNFFSFQSDF